MPFAAVLLAITPASVLDDLGYLGLVLLMLAETVFPPIPSEVVLPLAGYLVERGEMTFVLVILTSTIGSVLGAMLLYEAARRGGRPFTERFLRVARADPQKLVEAEAWFARRGAVVVLLGRCLPGVRSLVSLPAGLLRMPRLKYLGLTAVGSLVWNIALVSAGWALGSQFDRVEDVVGPLTLPVLVVLSLACAVAAAIAWRRRRATA